MSNEKDINSENTKDKSGKNPIVYWSIGFAVLSFTIGGAIGIIPIITIILSIIAITKTKEPDSGRWIAVLTLIVGILYLFTNSFNYGHFGNDDREKQPSYQYTEPTKNITVEKNVSPSNKVRETPSTESTQISSAVIESEVVQNTPPAESSQCRSDKLGYASCSETSSYATCLSYYDYETSCNTVKTNESFQCRRDKLGYASCSETSSHATCLSYYDYETSCNLLQINESSQCRRDKLGYASCSETSSHATCLSYYDYETSCK